jgi:hypothetical protein
MKDTFSQVDRTSEFLQPKNHIIQEKITLNNVEEAL